MDNRSIFSKTGKGSLEITKKSIKLSSEERQALILVDGKTAYGELQEKLSRIPPMKLRAVFDKLTELELIREFVAQAAPASAPAAQAASLAPGKQSAPGPAEDAELDFTALMSPAVAKAPAPSQALDFADFAAAPAAKVPAPAAAAPAASSVDAAEEARKFQEMMFGSPQPDPAVETARKAAEEAAVLRKADAARKVAEDQARRKALAERTAQEEAARKTAEAEARARADADRTEREETARKAAEGEARLKAEVERLEREAREREEAARKATEEAARKAAEGEARLKAEVERLEREGREREEAARKAGEAEARRQAEAERLQREEAARRVEAERLVREEAARKAAEEEARLKAEAERIAREAREREEAARRAAEAETQRRAEAERVAREEAARKAAEEEAHRKAEADRIEREAREREEAARRAAEEEARQRAEAERVAREETARKAAEEEARRKAEADRIEREAREREEAARRAAEAEAQRRAEAEHIAREEAARKAAEEEARRNTEAARLEHEAREQQEAAHRAEEEEARRRAEAEHIAREEAARKTAEEDKRRKAAAEREAREHAEREQLARDQAARHAAEEAEQRQALAEQTAREARDREARDREEREAAARQAAMLAAAAPAAAALTAPSLVEPIAEPASLDFNAEAKAAFDADLNFAAPSEETQRKSEVDRLMMGAFADTSLGGAAPVTAAEPDPFADTSLDSQSGAGGGVTKELETASRKEIEREAKERAKEEARAKKAAEKEARRVAKEGHIKLRRGGPSVMTMLIGVVLLSLAGGVAYLFMVPIDKAAIERNLADRLGDTVTVGSAKFSPFPPQLELRNVSVGSIKLATVIANPDPATLITERKIWKSVDVAGVTVSGDDLRKAAALALRDVPASAAAKAEVQRITFSGVDVTGLPVPAPKFNAVALLNAAGALKQITLSVSEGKAQVLLAPEDRGWTIDIESRGVTWPLGPKIAWESIRAKGIVNASGIKFDEYTVTHFGGNGRGAGELAWNSGWKFNGSVDAGNIDAEALGQAFYGAAPVAGTIDGKFTLALSSNTLNRLLDTPNIDGAFVASKAVLKSIDLARTAQTSAAAAGATRFSDFSATLTAAGGKLQIKELKGISGLLTVSGTAEVLPDKNLGGNLTVELGVGGARAKAVVKLAGTVADPKLSK